MKSSAYRSRFLWCILLALVMSVGGGCKKFADLKDVILVTGTENNKLVKFTVENTPSSFGVSATATRKADADITVNFAADTSLVASYNTETSAHYYVLPAGSYDLSGTTGVIKAGTNISNAVIVRIVSTAALVDGRTYILPVTIRSVSGPLEVLEASRTIYLKVARVIAFKSIDISDPAFYYPYTLATPVNNISKYTFEIKCYINSWHTGSPPISRLCNWGPVDQSLPNLLRFGEAGSQVNQLQWVSAEGSAFSSTLFALNTWYSVSCVYDGTSYKMYVNGKLDASFDGAGKVYQLGALELGMSYAGYQTAQRFLGRIAEVRFWNRALSVTEIQEGLCGVDAGANGLTAYWKMNEGSGSTFSDLTGKGRDMAWPKTPVWNTAADNKCAQ